MAQLEVRARSQSTLVSLEASVKSHATLKAGGWVHGHSVFLTHVVTVLFVLHVCSFNFALKGLQEQ